jgi:hypothetical protein
MTFYPTYGIEAEWGRDILSASAIRARVLEMTDGLSELAPSKSHWRFVDGADFKVTPLAEAASDMASFLARNIRGDSGAEPDPEDGYVLVLIGSENDGDTVAGNDLHLTAVVGSKSSNSLRFQVGDIRHPNDFSLITYPVYKAALECIASVWACPWALAYTFDTSSPHTRRQTPFDVAWMAYLSAPLAQDMAPPPEIVAERTGGGGMVLCVAPTVIDPSSRDDLRRSRALASVMVERVGTNGPRTGSPTRWPARVGLY